MRIADHDSNMYPYGPVMVAGSSLRVAFVPELRVLQARRSELPMATLRRIVDKMNARVRAGESPEQIEEDYQELLDFELLNIESQYMHTVTG